MIAAVQSNCTLPIAHHDYLLSVPIEIRPYISASVAAGRAGETVLNIRQPQVISPLVGHEGDWQTRTRVRYTKLFPDQPVRLNEPNIVEPI